MNIKLTIIRILIRQYCFCRHETVQQKPARTSKPRESQCVHRAIFSRDKTVGADVFVVKVTPQVHHASLKNPHQRIFVIVYFAYLAEAVLAKAEKETSYEKSLKNIHLFLDPE